MTPIRRIVLAVVLAAYAGLAVGCGDKKSEVPKDLNKDLPPPPATTGGKGGGKDAKANSPTSSAQ